MGNPLAVLTRSFGRRLAFTLALAGVGGALLTALLVNAAFQSRFDSFVQQQQQEREDQLLAVVTAAYVDAGGSWDAQALTGLAPAAVMSGAEVTIYDSSGRRVWSSADSPMGTAMGQRHRQMMDVGPIGPVRRFPVRVGGTQVGSMEVAVPLAELPVGEQAFLDSVNRLILGGAVGAGLIAVVAGIVLARRATRPVTELAAAARGLAAGERTRRADVTSEDEFGQLALAFNRMADTVEREDQVRRSFTSDVAHELRTPLAVLRTQIEAVQDGVSQPTASVLASLHEETVRLGRLVSDLETMTSADAAAFRLEPRPVPLEKLVDTVVAGLQDHLAAAHLTVTSQLTPITVPGDPDRLTQVLTNLLVNAVKFVPAGGHVSITVDESQGMGRLQVRDDGPGVDPADLPHVFDRFYRGQGPRVAGSGIGLAVVAEIVRAHGGRVRAAETPGGGATFTVWLPLPSPQTSAAFTDSSQPAPSLPWSRAESARLR